MTGAILRRLREHYGFARGDVARASGQHPCWVAVENGGKSYSAEATHNRRQRQNFAAYLDALRKLCGKPLKKRKTVTVQDATNTYHDALREWGW